MMTREEIMALSGRELDAAVAVGVLGWEWRRHGTDETSRLILHGPNGECGTVFWHDDDALRWRDDLPRYSSDIAAAWEVVEHIATPDEALTITYVKGDWVVAVGSVEVSATSESAPEAICRAALLTALKRSAEKNGGGEA